MLLIPNRCNKMNNSKPEKEYLKNFLYKFNYYCKTTHLHGLKYVGNSDNNILIRLFWAITFGLFFVNMVMTFITLLKNNQDNSISFLTETTYLDWNTTFPSITVCQIAGFNSSLLEPPYDPRDTTATFEFFIADLLFFSGNCYSCETLCYSCPKVNISKTVSKLRKQCNEILGSCKWNNVEFNCCEEFMPLETELGICYSINSMHTKKPFNSKLNWKVNRKTGAGKLFIETIEDVRVYFHAPEDVPFMNADANQKQDVIVGDVEEVVFNVMEIENDNTIIDVPIVKRECRFPKEVPPSLKVHQLYSYSTCSVQCHAETHYEFCNCTHHFMPYYSKQSYCDINGLKCLTDNFDMFNRLRVRDSDKLTYLCECLPSCTEPEYNIVSHKKNTNQSISGIFFKMQSLPTSRFRRVVVKTSLDLVVSIGGAAGLFIGASILTIIEALYLLIIKM